VPRVRHRAGLEIALLRMSHGDGTFERQVPSEQRVTAAGVPQYLRATVVAYLNVRRIGSQSVCKVGLHVLMAHEPQ
jgi:hypothetical protein